nr:IBR domain-containing protein [Tanacetum cinerariifolium]
MNHNIEREELTMITAEQHREFMAAAAIDSDLDFAYRLQLEEVINASKTLTNPQNDVVMTDVLPEPEPMIITEAVYIPHGEGSSNTKNIEEENVFRVYFKGIVSEERVGNQRKVNLAGIGVAICDVKGEVVFEKRKEVEVVRGERMSKGSVEGMALLEALNGAVVFGVKRAVLCFDYHTLFQYVSGRWQPKQQKIQTFVDEVNRLRKKFTHCEPSLIAKKDVKLAYKLAREAVSSQITKAMESSKKIENCHVEAKLRDGMMPKCPYEGCESEMKVEGCENILTPKLAELMKQLLKEASIPSGSVDCFICLHVCIIIGAALMKRQNMTVLVLFISSLFDDNVKVDFAAFWEFNMKKPDTSLYYN